MNKIFAVIAFLVFAFYSIPGSAVITIAPNGEYVGLEQMPNPMPDEEPGAEWFHENSLVIRKDEAILDKQPIRFLKGEKAYSASEGGFLTYRGRFVKRNGKTYFSARLFQSEYAADEDYSTIHTFPVKIFRDGLEIDRVRYRRAELRKELLNSLVEYLKTEPLE